MVTLTEVEAAISTKRLGWQAAETALSAAMASPGRFGLRPANLTERTLQVATVTPHGFRPKRPLKVDWYELGRVSSVKSQGLCGACVAFAICAAMESSLAIADDVETTLDLSEADLFCGCGDCCESGWDFVPALERAGKGVGLEANLAYGVNIKCKAIPPALRVSSWETTLSAEDRRYAVARGPVIAGMHVFDDFRYYTGGIYEHATGDEIGLHAVCVIGYDDAASCWIAKNSWSEAWGEKGLFRIAYGQCGLDQELPFIGIEVERV